MSLSNIAANISTLSLEVKDEPTSQEEDTKDDKDESTVSKETDTKDGAGEKIETPAAGMCIVLRKCCISFFTVDERAAELGESSSASLKPPSSPEKQAISFEVIFLYY